MLKSENTRSQPKFGITNQYGFGNESSQKGQLGKPVYNSNQNNRDRKNKAQDGNRNVKERLNMCDYKGCNIHKIY